MQGIIGNISSKSIHAYLKNPLETLCHPDSFDIVAAFLIYKSTVHNIDYMSSAFVSWLLSCSGGPGVVNNDDRVLECCLQYQALYPEGALVLCT